MARFSAEQIIAATGAKQLSGSPELVVQSVTTDSRTVSAGTLFVPLRGERFDGHRFIAAAAANGAVAVLTEKEPLEPLSCAVFKVDDTRRALLMLAGYHRRRFPIDVVAVTGSSGKTTTKEFIAAILAQKYKVHKTEKNYNNEIGVAQTLLSLTDEDEVCVVEMGMRARGEIADLALAAAPTVGVVTNVGVAHIERLKTQDNIALAKRELIEALPPNGTAILNSDDTRTSAMASAAAGRVLTFGCEDQAMVRALDVRYLEGKTGFTCRSFDEVFPVSLLLLGEHNVYNALAAIAVARVLRVGVAKIQRALSQVVPGELRQKTEMVDGVCFVNDSYNANPVSLRMALKTLFQYGSGRKVAVLGDMLELGSRTAVWHEEIGRFAGNAGVELVVAVGQFAHCIARGAESAGVKAYVCPNCEEAAVILQQELCTGDVVLVKGSHSMHMESTIRLWKEGR